MSNKYERILEAQEKFKELIREQVDDKYDCAGVYAILLNHKIVYIGKSLSVIDRISQHMYHLRFNDDNAHKYQVLNQAKIIGLNIGFDLLYKSYSEEVEEDIGYMEGKLIRQYLPFLNTQIPKEENWRKFTINPEARKITAEELAAKLA